MTTLNGSLNPDVIGQAEAEGGVATTQRIWTSQRVAQAIAALASPAGATTQVQFNNAGAFGGDAGFRFDPTTQSLVVENIDATYPGAGITASGIGALAVGSTKDPYSVVGPGVMDASGAGAFVFGQCAYKGSIIASGAGSIAGGPGDFVENDVIASGLGSVAIGSAYGFLMEASGNGSVVHGFADNAAILASATNSFQFGPGNNAQAGSLEVGTTMRLKGTVGVPTSNLHNGDLWVDGAGKLYGRSGGVSKELGAAGGAPEGTAVLSTGEVGGTKFLREDGDGTSSWQAVAGGGTPAGSNGEMQFNNGGAFGANSQFVFDNSTVSLRRHNQYNAFVSVTSTGAGSSAQGYVKGYSAPFSGILKSSGVGSVASGSAFGGLGSLGEIAASGVGAHAFGYTYGANLHAFGVGSMAMGNVYGAGNKIYSQGYGSFAGGYAPSGSIIATGVGSFAFGSASVGDIIATAGNSMQFGIGTNAEADTLAVGTTCRLKGTTGAPVTPRNGDMWVDAAGHVFARGNGVSVQLT